MHSWIVRCVGVDEDSAHDDCRAITRVGRVVAENLDEQSADVVSIQIDSDTTAYHIEVDGERVPLRSASDGPLQYVRTLAEDSPDDPLLDLPSIEQYERDERFAER